MPGIVIGDKTYNIDGVRCISPGEESWCRMASDDCGPRTQRIQQVTIHTTQGKWPHILKPGSPPDAGARAKQVASYWSLPNGIHGGAPFIVDGKVIACLHDIKKWASYHATTVNGHSVGIEMVQEPDGTIYEDTLDTTVKLVLLLCDVLGIPLQVSSVPYRNNKIIERLRDGGRRDTVGVFGHNENAWMFPQWLSEAKRRQWPQGYADRGQGDPGDEIKVRLRAAGAMAFNFDRGEDLAFWKRVQADINAKYKMGLAVDGICGPGTHSAMKQLGIWRGGRFTEYPVP